MTAASPAERFDAIASRLECVRPQQARNTARRLSARCPAHDDASPSLIVSLTGDGKILLHCIRGCTPGEVLAALGMRLRDLREQKDVARPEPQLCDVYDYIDAGGELRYQVLRYAPKTFRQRRPDGRGGWAWNLDGVEPLPFRLPELRRADRVLVVEGEKDVLTAGMLGVAATCNSGGACRWSDALSPHLAGKSVAILPDNDAKGREHAYLVAGSLLAHGVGSVRIVPLPGVPAGGDLTAWAMRLPGKAASLEGRVAIVRAALFDLIARTPAYRVQTPTAKRN